MLPTRQAKALCRVGRTVCMSDPARTPERMDNTTTIRTAGRSAGFCSMQLLGIRSNKNRYLTMRASTHKVGA